MKKYGYTAIICAAAMMLAASGCKSEEIAATTTPAETIPAETSEVTAPAAAPAGTDDTTAPASETRAAETTTVKETDTESPASEVTTAAHTPDETFETTVINGESVVVMTTSSQAVTAAVTTTTTAASSETTKATTNATTTKKEEVTEATNTQKAVPDEGDIKLEIISGADVITTKVAYISVKASYLGDDESCFYLGEQYTLEKLVDGKWETIPFADDVCWLDIAYEVSQYSQPTITVNLEKDTYKVPLTPGKYHVGISVSSVESRDPIICFAEFEIVDSVEEPEYELIETNGHERFIIDEIKEDRFECEMYFPLPLRYSVLCDTSKYEDFCVGDYIEVDYSEMYMIDSEHFRVIPTSIEFSDFMPDPDVCYKPVIYLYPQEETEVSVKLDFNGRLTITDPEYGEGWTVTAKPDGTLICEGREYPYLFWEGKKNYELDTSSGFCVRGRDTAKFLAEKLAYLGLNESESREFMEFWLSAMTGNEYNIITFAGKDYTDNAKLDIAPSPDTLIRVFMTYTPSSCYVDIPEQTLEPAPERDGFTVVEWGGCVTLTDNG